MKKLTELNAVWLTLQLDTTTVLLLLVGTPLAWWLAHSPARNIEALTAMPLVMPPTVIGFYLLLLFSPNGWLGVLVYTHRLYLAFSFSGLVLASMLYSYRSWYNWRTPLPQ